MSRRLAVVFLGLVFIQSSLANQPIVVSDYPVTVFGPETVKVADEKECKDDDDDWDFGNRGVSRWDSKNFSVSNDKLTYLLQVQNHGARGAVVVLRNPKYYTKLTWWLRDVHLFQFKKADEVIRVPVQLSQKNLIKILAYGSGGTSATVTVLGPAALLPPAPETVKVVPPPGTSSSNLAAIVSFLYSGKNPIQTGVAEGTIDEKRVAVIRGKALDTSLAPLSGATVTVVGHPEFGQTLTRLDGMFDIVVNGNQTVTVQIAKSGYIVMQRQVQAPARDFAVIPDFVMTALDSSVTAIRAGQNSIQVAQGSTVTDSSGTRTASVLFPAGTRATMVMPNGTETTLSNLSVRATEVTVGANGPMAMPGKLPADSAYTYAVEFSVDEALDAGATSVKFSQPVFQYIDNFLKFPVGTPVPVGYYDRALGRWLPLQNGRVIKILSIAKGIAQVDVSGKGVAATATELASLSMTSAELQRLATMYKAGQSFWRSPLPHFSIVDDNWPDEDETDFEDPDQPSTPNPPPCCIACGCPAPQYGSIIDQTTQTLRERISVVGTPFSLNYASDRTPDRTSAYTIHIPLIGNNVGGIVGVHLDLNIAGIIVSKDFAPSPNLSYDFTWDGVGVYGWVPQGPMTGWLMVSYKALSRYAMPNGSSQAFGLPSNTSFSTQIPSRSYVEGHRGMSFTLGTWDSKIVGLGGWTLDVHHAYDLVTHTVYYGDGGKSLSQPAGNVTSVFAGNGLEGNDGDFGMATSASFYNTTGVVRAPDGTIYVTSSDRIRRIDSTGKISAFAGYGNSTADGVSVGQASIQYLGQLAWGALDSSLYYADEGAGTIRKISPSNLVTTVATKLQRPHGLSVSTDGTVFFTKINMQGVFRVLSDGSSMLEPGTEIFGTTPGIAWSARENALYIAGGGHFEKRMAGFQPMDYSGLPGGSSAAVLAVDPAGGLVFETYNGLYYRLIGNQSFLIPLDQSFVGVGQIAPLPDGSVLLAAQGLHQVLKISPKYTGFTGGTFQVASSDGTQIFTFDSYGRHLQTQDALTGAVIYLFGYESHGYLATITDVSGNTTTIDHDVYGNALDIVSPYGVRTYLNINPNGRISTVSDPIGRAYQMMYSGLKASLLSIFTHPNGGGSVLTYDGMGRLIADQDPMGGVQTYARKDLSTDGRNFTVTRTSATGVVDTHTFQTLFDGSQHNVDVHGSDNPSVSSISAAGLSQTTAPDGVTYSYRQAPDPRFGYQSPYTSEKSMVLATNEIGDHYRTTRTLASNPTVPSAFVLTDTTVRNDIDTRTSVYDSASRTRTNTSFSGRVSYTKLDNKGRLAQFGGLGVLEAGMSYDVRGRLSQIQQGSRVTQMSYDSNGYLQSVKNALGQVTQYARNPVGQLMTQTLPDSRQIQFSYDANGNIASITPPGRPSTSFLSDLSNLLGIETAPAAGGASLVTHYAHNLDKQLTQITRPDGSLINYFYDLTSGRLSGTTAQNVQEAISYNSAGKLSSISYTPTDRPGDEVDLNINYITPFNVKYAWSGAMSEAVQVMYNFDDLPDGKFLDLPAIRFLTFPGAPQDSSGDWGVSYYYDADMQLLRSAVFNLDRDPKSGNVTSFYFNPAPGQWSGFNKRLYNQFQYNSYGEVSQIIATTQDNVSVYSENVTRDDLGRIISRTEMTAAQGSHTFDYTFDPAGRLTQVKKDGSVSSSYVYDSNSNRISQTTSSGTVTSSVDAQDKLTQMGSIKYAYDKNGQLISKTDTSTGKVTQYGYNGLGQLTSVTMPDGSLIQYVLDGQGLRLGKKVNGVFTERYLYDEVGRIVTSFDQNNHPKNIYVYHTSSRTPDAFFRFSSPDELSPSQLYHVVLDHLGSPKLVVNVFDNSIVEELSYDEFGNVTLDTNPGFQPFGFAGGLYDRDTKLVHFGAREYDALMGRWLSRDSIGFAGKDTNLYGYVLNDPINFIDPEGLNRKAAEYGGSGGGGGGNGPLVLGAIAAAAVGGSYVTSCQSPPVRDAIDYLRNIPDFNFDPADPNEILPQEVRDYKLQ